MVKETKRKADKKEDKIGRLAEAISELSEGESVSPTALAERANIKQPTLIDTLHEHNILEGVGFKIFEDKGKIKLIVRSRDEVNLRQDIQNIRHDIIEIKASLDKIKTSFRIN